MVSGDRSTTWVVNVPSPPPLSVLLSLTVGFEDVLQHIPRTSILAPPSSLMFPSANEEVDVIFETSTVVMVGFAGSVLKLTCEL